jgi:uncharacterized protein (TIGR02453 family)
MSNRHSFSGFPQESLQFYKELAANNNRDWFKAHEQDYSHYVLEPAQAFVIRLGERLKTISSGIAYSSLTNGTGSVMRIHRDIRFSKDKSPYHTYLRIIFWEGKAKKTENPGFYFSMDAYGGGLFAGMHMFSKELLEIYRKAVVDPELGKQLEDGLTAIRSAGKYEIGGEYYKRVPIGYPVEHKRSGLLLYNGLYVISPKIEATTITSPEVIDVCYAHCYNMAPVQQWLGNIISFSGKMK